MLQQVFQLIQKVLSKWLNDAQVVEVSPGPRGLILAQRIASSLLPAVWSVENKEGRPQH